MIRPVALLRFDRQAGRLLELPPSQEREPAFLLPVSAILDLLDRGCANFALTQFSEVACPSAPEVTAALTPLPYAS